MERDSRLGNPKFWTHTLWVMVAAIVPRTGLLAYRVHQAEGLGLGLNAYGSSDVPGWLGAASHLTNHLDLSYWFFAARPPLFPFTVSLVFRSGGGPIAALVLQTVFSVMTAVVILWLAHEVFAMVPGLDHPESYTLAAGLVAALDPASVVFGVTLLAEPLFNLTFALCLYGIARHIRNRSLWMLLLAALALTASMLTRGTTIYFWVVTPLIFIPLVKDWWKPALALAAAGLLVYFGYSFRNLQYNGVYTYSLQTNFQLLFMRGLAAERFATDADPGTLQDSYAAQVYLLAGDEDAAANIEPGVTWWGMLAADSPEVYEAMGNLARQKLIEYWPYVILTTGIGFVRMFAVTGYFPAPVQAIEAIYHLALYGLTLLGAWRAYKGKSWALLLITVVPVLYITGLTMISQTSALDTRMRTPITASLAILSVYGAGAVWAWWQGRRAKDEVSSASTAS